MAIYLYKFNEFLFSVRRQSYMSITRDITLKCFQLELGLQKSTIKEDAFSMNFFVIHFIKFQVNLIESYNTRERSMIISDNIIYFKPSLKSSVEIYW
jgi:hypothetical protein